MSGYAVRSWIVLIGFAVLAAGCTGDGAVETSDPSVGFTPPTRLEKTTTTATTTTTTTTTVVESAYVPTLSPWTGYLAALTVPLDHDDPSGPTIEVPVARVPATDPENRIGVLLVNPGGPGYPASPLVLFAEQVFTPELRARFDIVALDPRGTFPATEVNCFTDLGELWSAADYSPETPEEVEQLDTTIQGWVDDCAAEYGDMLEHVSTMDTVHDMALLVEALGEDQVSYLGFSYGTALGSAFVTEYPGLVRAAVFDGAYFASEDPFESLIDTYAAIDALLVRIFDECDSDPACPISGGAQAAFTRVAAAADDEPLVDNRLLPAVNEQGVIVAIRFSEAAYGGSADPLLRAMANADKGSYMALQGLVADAAALLEAGGSALAISCMDSPYRDLVEVPDNAVERLKEIAPTLEAVFPTPEGFDPFTVPDDCMRWPAGPDLLPDPLSGAGAGPILVVTATDDPVTPMASAEKLADELVNGTLLVVDSAVHGSYQIEFPGAAPARRCATDYMDRFLIDLEPPPEGTICE